ncbi:PQQ-binding-like beta-propeller repeat protein [Verrucomicrobia bacterium]|nr:PQQ-binding-like beta-propeller repeat protein [Verrucomicrobiota bacterium]
MNHSRIRRSVWGLVAGLLSISNLVTMGQVPQLVSAECEFPDGLIGYWPGEGDSTDATGASDGVTKDVEYAAGKVGQAYRFVGGDSFVRVPTTEALRSFSSITMECWVWNDATRPFTRLMTLTPDWVRLKLFEGRPEMVVSLGGGELVGATSDESLAPNSWHHIAGTYDGSRSLVYVDGDLVAEGIASSFTPMVNDGAASEVYLNFFNAGEIGGLIDEPAIYNRALSAEEIKSHFDAGNEGICKPTANELIEPSPQSNPGTLLWEFETGGKFYVRPCLSPAGLIYASSKNGKFFALNARTGEKQWEFDAGLFPGDISASSRGVVYFTSNNGLTAHEESTGAEVWRRGFRRTGGPWKTHSIGSDGTIYLLADSKIYALSPGTYKPRWTIEDAFTSVAIGSDGTVFFVGSDGLLRAHDGRSGEFIWGLPKPRSSFSPIIDDEGNVYVTSNEGILFSFSSTRQKLNWEAQLEGTLGWPAMGASVYVGSDKTYAIDPVTGGIKWVTEAGGSIESPAVAADETVYVVAQGILYAFRGEDGATLWKFDGGDQSQSSPIIGADGTVYFGASDGRYDGRIFAIKGSAGPAKSNWSMLGRNSQHTGRAADITPQIVEQPENQVGALNSEAVFKVGAVGSPGIYEWYHEGIPIQTGVADSLVISNLSSEHAGEYRVRITNPAGSVQSETATLTLHRSLTLDIRGPGQVEVLPDLPSYPPGTEILLTPIPDDGKFFLGWEGDAEGKRVPLRLNIDQNLAITSVFVDTELKLSIQGDGHINPTPSTPRLPPGTKVLLDAVPGRWHRFARWLDGGNANPREVGIGEGNSYIAVFEPTVALETVTVDDVSRVAPFGMPAIIVDNVFVVAALQVRIDSSKIDLKTTLPEASIFYTLDGSDPTFLGHEFSGPFEIGRSASIRAIAYNFDFTKSVESDPIIVQVLPSRSLEAWSRGGGNIQIDPPEGPYLDGQVVTATAIPDPDWTFIKWRGSISSVNPQFRLEINSDKKIEAVFGTTLKLNSISSGRIDISEPNPVPYGRKVRLTAIPNMGRFFFR